MAEFLTTKGISFQIENIIINSVSTLYLVSPYLKLTSYFYERLCDAEKKGVKIIIIYGKDELKPDQESKLAKLKNLELYFSKNLHAKCYSNESNMVITSMNMYDYSEQNNREMGILIDKNIDNSIYAKALDEIISIKNSSIKEELHKNQNSYNMEQKTSPLGFCIRCCAEVKLNPNYPLCDSCYAVWAIWENSEWQEKYCHKCGKERATTKYQPLCDECGF